MFNEFFTRLGFNVVLSDETNKEIISLSQDYSLEETCYPVKIINGHVQTLIDKGVDYIFLPSLYSMRHPVCNLRENYACVYMQAAPKIIERVMDLKGKGIKLLSPSLSFNFGKIHMMQELMDLGEELGKNKVQTAIALTIGMAKIKKFQDEVNKIGEEIEESLNKGEKVFIIITRLYCVSDRGLNMDISNRLRKMGYKVYNLYNLPAYDIDISEDYPNMYWPFGHHVIAGARIVKQKDNLFAIYLTNHGCGPDTILNHYFKKEMGDKPYLHIELDEHASNVRVMTRLEAFVESIKDNKIAYGKDENKPSRKYSDNSILYIPYLYPYSNLLKSVLIKKGIDARILNPTSDSSLELGRKYTTSKEYVSLTALIGDVLSEIETINKNQGRILIPQNEGSETFGQYSKLISHKLEQNGYGKIVIDSPFIEDLPENELYGTEFIYSLIAGDIIMSAPKECREQYLSYAVSLIENGELNESTIILMAKDVYSSLSSHSHKKNIFAVGEINAVFNKAINHGQLDKLEDNYKVFYQPMSELMYFKWNDFLKKEKKEHLKIKNFQNNMKMLMATVSRELCEYSPFSNNIDELLKVSDNYLPMFNGGDGRYRMAKICNCTSEVNGILSLSPMYENTGIIIKLLREENDNEVKIPTVDLFFDSSADSGNEEKIQNFIYYI